MIAAVRSCAGAAAITAALTASLVIPLGSGSSAASASPTGSGAAARRAVAACPVSASASGRYVAFLFDEILGRCPDAGAARYWTAVLDGGASRWSVAEAIDTSTENLGRNNVDPLYQGLLGRPPTSSERTYWISFLRTAHQNATPTAALLASNEGYARHSSGATAADRDAAWLDAAYNRILDRAPDPQGAQHYLQKLAPASTRSTRMAVAMSLERSAPNADSWVRAAMTEALGRTPDPAGIRHWTAWLTGPGRWQTFRLWTHLLSSDEAFRRAQATG